MHNVFILVVVTLLAVYSMLQMFKSLLTITQLMPHCVLAERVPIQRTILQCQPFMCLFSVHVRFDPFAVTLLISRNSIDLLNSDASTEGTWCQSSGVLITY